MLAAASAAAYFLGFLYLSGYYARLGVAEGELDFGPGFVQVQSWLPLLHPIFWLAMIAVFTSLPRGLAGRTPHPAAANRNPFAPVPALRVVAVVYGVWAWKLLLDVLHGPDGAQWLGWERRGALAVAFGAFVLAGFYATAYGVGGRLLGRWTPSSTRGGNILLATLVVMLVMVSASLTGNAKAAREVEGCEARSSIAFHPSPPVLDGNATYWLVLHQGDTYYLRDAANATGPVLIVKQDAGMTAVRGRIPAGEC